jgi:myo-inositol-1(or 4)-monophosphatase
MTAWNPSEIADLLLEAGHTAVSFLEDSSPSLKDDRTIVTEADTRIEHQLAEHFDAPGKGVYMIGEETNEERGEAYVHGALEGITWVVDPIDGTSPYAHGLPHWGVSIGLMRRRRLTDGGIFLPASGEMAVTDGDTVLFGRLGCDPDRWDTSRLEPLRFSPPESPGRSIVSLPQDIVKRGTFTGEYTVHAVGSCVSSIIALLTGSFAGYVGNIKLWDVGAAVPLVQRFGFVMKLADGTPYDGSVDEESFILDPDSSRRWRMRTHLFMARDEQTCDNLIAHTWP